MALNVIDYVIYRELSKAKLVPAQPDVLELGEANWYGDVEITQLAEDFGSGTAGLDPNALILPAQKSIKPRNGLLFAL